MPDRFSFDSEEAYVWWLIEDTRRMRNTLGFRLARLGVAVQELTNLLTDAEPVAPLGAAQPADIRTDG